jgi:hypothetical protein
MSKGAFSMSRQQNLTTVDEIYHAVGSGDIDAILDRVNAPTS